MIAAFAVAAACLPGPATPDASNTAASQPSASALDAEVARGAYLARVGDCAACHTGPGAPAYTGGLALHSPLGTMYSTNITPDPETGIGRYSLADFERALREGRTPDHRLYPAMPYPSFAKVSDADIRSLYAYFVHGVKPVRRVPPKTDLPFPFDQRWGMALWDLAFLEGARYHADPRHDADWNRGAYLVQGLGHCGSCHTPRGLAYEERGYTHDSPHYLTGGVTEHWAAPNLTGEPVSGLGDWHPSHLEQFLKTGVGAGTMVFGPMTQVVTDSTQHLSDADVHAIALYLKSIGAHPSGGTFRAGVTADPRRSVAWLATGDVHVPGDGIFASECAGCHGVDGAGEARKAPRLAGNAVVRAPDASSVIHMILSGGKGQQPRGLEDVDPMPAFADRFDDRQIAELASFVRQSWGNGASAVDARTVARERAAAAKEGG